MKKVLLFLGFPLLSVAVSGTIPMPSDVCFTSRSVHTAPLGNNNTFPWLNTSQAATDFHATRMDWVYTTDEAFMESSRARGWPVTAAINGMVPDNYDGPATYNVGRIENLFGEKLTAPWMRTWPTLPYYGCVNNPKYVKNVLARAAKLVASGATGIQHDDPHCNVEAVNWKDGGCYCSHCMKKFRTYALDRGLTTNHSFDYKDLLLSHGGYKYQGAPKLRSAFVDFQTASVVSYVHQLRAHLENSSSVAKGDHRVGEHSAVLVAPKVALSCNNGGTVWDSITSVFDFGMGELAHELCTPYQLHDIFLHPGQGGKLPNGKKQIVTMPKTSSIDTEDKILTRKGVAIATALGGNMLVPWDIYLPTPNALRFYGNVSDFEDLYLSIRVNGQALDQYTELLHTWYAGPAVLSINTSTAPGSDIYFVVRGDRSNTNDANTATPTEPLKTKNVLVHLFDWHWGSDRTSDHYPLPTTPSCPPFPVQFNASSILPAGAVVRSASVAWLNSTSGEQVHVPSSTMKVRGDALVSFEVTQDLNPWAMFIVKVEI